MKTSEAIIQENGHAQQDIKHVGNVILIDFDENYLMTTIAKSPSIRSCLYIM